MKRRIITWVATGAVVLGIGAAGVGAVVANSHSASAQNGTPVAAAPATMGSQMQTATSTPAQSAQSGQMMNPQGNEGSDGGGQAKATTIQAGAGQQAGGTTGMTGAAGNAQGG